MKKTTVKDWFTLFQILKLTADKDRLYKKSEKKRAIIPNLFPHNYTVNAYIREEKCFNLEQRIHNEILRPNPNFDSIREWHNISFDEAIDLVSREIKGLTYQRIKKTLKV